MKGSEESSRELSRSTRERDTVQRVMALRVALILIVGSFAAFLLLFQSARLFDPSRYLLGAVLSLGHIPLFGLLAWTVLVAINLKTLRVSEWPVWSYAAAFLITMVLSFLSELVQIITPRDASVEDIFFNNLGGVLFLGFLLLWRNRGFEEISGRRLNPLRVAFLVASVLTLAAAVRPLILVTIDEIEKVNSFPVIASFETEREVSRWDGGDSHLSLAKEHAEDGKYSLRVELSPGEYSGIRLPHPPRDWRGFRSLRFMVFNPSKKSVRLVLKVFDYEHNYKYSDRFNKAISLSAGKNVLYISLREIEFAPNGRRMRMDRIAQISFFVSRLKEREVLYFDNIRLLREGA